VALTDQTPAGSSSRTGAATTELAATNCSYNIGARDATAYEVTLPA
jgi:hypothetical protein